MKPREGWTPKGKAATDVVLRTFRANGAEADRLVQALVLQEIDSVSVVLIG
jgi:hypothetical protein